MKHIKYMSSDKFAMTHATLSTEIKLISIISNNYLRLRILALAILIFRQVKFEVPMLASCNLCLIIS